MIRTGGLDDYEDQEDYQPVIGGYCPVEVDGAPCNGDLYVHVQNGRVVCEDGHQVGNKAERSVVEVPFPKTAMPVDRNFLDGLEYNYSLPVWKVHTLTAAPAGNFLNPIGAIEWRDDNKEVSQVYVAPEHRHKGVASELWHRAKKIEPDLKHSWEMTPAGRDWVTSLGPEDAAHAAQVDEISKSAAAETEDAGKYREDWAGMGPYNHEEHEAVWKNYNWDLPNRSAFEGILKKRTEEGEELGPFYKHIAEDGQFFRELSPHERPPGEKGYCHYNVGRAIKEGLPKGWKAAAGWAGGGSGHVWLLDEEDRVVDPTLRNITMPNHFGVIVDNPERFLRQDEEHWVFDPGEFDSEQHHASTYYHAIHNDALPIALRHGLRGGADAKDDPEGIGYTYLFDDLDVARGWGSEDDYTVLEVDPPGEVEQDPYMGSGVASRFRGDIPPDRIRVAQVQRYCVKCKKQFDESEEGSYAGFCGNCREKEGLVDHAWWSEDAQAGHYGATEGYEYHHLVDEDENHAIVAMQGSETAGIYNYRLKGGNAYGYNIDVAKDHRQKGIAKSLYEKLFEVHPGAKAIHRNLTTYGWDLYRALKRDDPERHVLVDHWHQPMNADPSWDWETYDDASVGRRWPDRDEDMRREGARGHRATMAIGIPGSGKSTMLKPYADKVGAAYVSSDETRGEVTGDPGDVSRDAEVWPLIYQKVHDALDQGDVVVDATFSNGEKRRDMVRHLRLKADEVHGIWFDIPLDVAHERNLARERKVPPEIIDAMHKQVQDDPPSEDEGFDSITKVGSTKTATYERPQKLWHVTDRRNRESILQHGLDPAKSDVWGGTDYPHTWAFDHPQKAKDLAEALGRSESRKQLDVWEVDSSGLNVVPDPHGKYENSWAIIGPTPPERLGLQPYEGGGYLQKGWDLWKVHYPPEEESRIARKQYPAEALFSDLPPLPSPAPEDPGEKSRVFKEWADARRQRRGEFLDGPKMKDYGTGHPYRAPGGCSNCGQQGEWFDASYHAYCPSCRSSWFSRWEEFPAGTKTPEGGDEEEWEAEMGRGPQAEILGK